MLRKFKSVASVVLVLSLFLSSLPQITFASVASSTKELLSFSNEVNAAPVLEVIGNKTVNEGSHLTFTATATDSDSASLTYSLVDAPTGASINATTGVFTWTPTEAQGPGSYTFSVRVSDGALTDEGEIIVTVNEINEAPVLGAIGNKTVDEETLLTFTATATDADLPANMLTYSLVGAQTGASINPITGVFTWTPTEAQGPGSYTFTVRVSDGILINSERITITVNETNAAPILGAIGNKTVNEGSQLTFTATATDSDSSTLTYSLVGAPTGASINLATGEFTWTPSEAQGPGSYPFIVRVSDGMLTDDETITVTVNQVNIAPVLVPIGNKTVNAGTLLTFTATATDADLPPNTLTYSLVAAPSGASINATTGVFTWTPTEAQGPGSYSFEVVVSDGALTDRKEITVTVNEVNAAPVLAVIGNKTVNEGSHLTFTATATDSDSVILTYSLVGAPLGASINATTGVFTWTPSETQGPGSYPFMVRVSDGTLTDDETITVTVNEVNVAPVLVPIGNKTVNTGTLLTFTATATDADLPANTLTYSLVGAPTGASIDATTGVFTWTPTEAQGPGVYPFIVRVSDGTLTDGETITVTVNEVNVAPVLVPIGNKTVNEGSHLTFTATATDADLPANMLSYSLVGAPTGASIDATTGVFTWTPTEAQGPGVYPFIVRVSDGTLTDDETITVTVNEVNVAPVLVPIGNKTVNAGTLLTFTATATDADLPPNTLTYSLVAAPPGASINPLTGVFTWTPTEAQGPGSYRFEVVVSDGALTDRKEITVTVTRAASSNVDLSGLTLSSGTVSPAFSPATTSYTASVGNGVTSIAVTPTTADAGATVKANGVTVTSGVTSGAIPLTMGANPIIVEVTAQDSISTQTYTLTVTRARASGGDGGAQPAIPTEPEPGPAPEPEPEPEPEPSIEPPITENPEKNALDFVDVDMENWASEAIQSLVSKGIILGYPNNEFRPNEFIRREHMVVMISRLGLLTERREVAEFTDVPTQYVYYNEIRLAQLAGIIEGSDGEFWPKQPLTRAQAAKVIVLLFGLETESAKSFEDVPDKVWYAPYINTLASRGIVFGDGIYFKPNDNVTRAQFAAMLYRALQQIES